MHKLYLTVAFFVTAFISNAQQNNNLQNGSWRVLLERKDGNNIVFNFDVKDTAGKKILYIRNAAERLLVDNISFDKDSVFITLPFFESQLRAIINNNELKGVWLKRLVNGYGVVPFTAFYNQPFRFIVAAKHPLADVSGKWSVNFLDKSGKSEEAAIGEFKQQGSYVYGTFLTTTGDYRYLQGVIDGDSLKLSCFDGGHAYLFIAKVDGDTLSGAHLFSGATFKQDWIGIKNSAATLPDVFSITKMKQGEKRFDFSFKDIDGKNVSINDARFKNKVLILQIMGSWCPNCMDETNFLSTLYDQYKDKGVEIIGLAYERTTDFARSQKSLQSFQKRFNVKYTLLITGVSVSDSLKTEKTLPQLEKIVGFPTTIFINRKGEVEKIHTGFNGPGTGKHYEEQKKEFYDIIDNLLANKAE